MKIYDEEDLKYFRNVICQQGNEIHKLKNETANERILSLQEED